MILPPTPTLSSPYSSGNFGYAGLAPGLPAFYLPDSTRPTAGTSYVRNLTLEQIPMTETTILVGDGQRKVMPLQLTGICQFLDEEAARVWATGLEESAVRWTRLQRSANVTRALLRGTTVDWPPSDKPWIRPFVLTLNPAGPSWLDALGRSVPF